MKKDKKKVKVKPMACDMPMLKVKKEIKNKA